MLKHFNRDLKGAISEIAVRHCALMGYSAQALRWGFERMFSHWEECEMCEWLMREIPEFPVSAAKEFLDLDMPFKLRRNMFERLCPEACRRVCCGREAGRLLMVTASTVPSAGLQDLLLSLLLPIKATLRPAKGLSAFFKESLALLEGAIGRLAGRVQVVASFRGEPEIVELCKEQDFVVISGSDETIKLYDSCIGAIGAAPRLVAHGHKVSAVGIFKTDDLQENDLWALALDVAAWHQMGCLSPRCIFVEGGPERGLALARALKPHLEKALDAFNPPEEDLFAKGKKNNALLMSQLDGGEVIRCGVRGDAMAVYPSLMPFKPIFLSRVLNIFSVSDCILGAEKLAPFGQGFATRHALGVAELERLRRSGYNYFCRFGNMQDPPLTWFHDGVGTVAPLIGALQAQKSCGCQK